MQSRTIILLSVLGAVSALFVFSRTDRGAAAIGGALDALTPRGIRNNNPGNIDWIADPAKRWRGMVRKETAAEGGRFGVFDTPANGVRAIAGELRADWRRGVRTVHGLISNWAPSTENNTRAYAYAVANEIHTTPDAIIDVIGNLPEIATAIIRHENGQVPYSRDEIETWVNS